MGYMIKTAAKSHTYQQYSRVTRIGGTHVGLLAGGLSGALIRRANAKKNYKGTDPEDQKREMRRGAFNGALAGGGMGAVAGNLGAAGLSHLNYKRNPERAENEARNFYRNMYG